jgi:hypothetical protein
MKKLMTAVLAVCPETLGVEVVPPRNRFEWGGVCGCFGSAMSFTPRRCFGCLGLGGPSRLPRLRLACSTG